MYNDQQRKWKEYCDSELQAAMPLLTSWGVDLDEEQPHIGGERYLLQNVTTASGRKLILLGKVRDTGKRVVIKVTSDKGGRHELEHERECRKLLSEIEFAYQAFLSPTEVRFEQVGALTISIQEFIEQERSFLERPLEEQFTLALKAFKTQEGAHATTYGHARHIVRHFGQMLAQDYLKLFSDFSRKIRNAYQNEELDSLLKRALDFLTENRENVEQYTGFLTHTDFVPHNIRVVGDDIYLLDHSSLRFGNKYEGWARFINFMVLYNRPLASALLQYVKDNRTPEESLSLRLMRTYRLGEIIWFYVRTLEKSSGDMRTLTEARILFWTSVLASVLDNQEIPESMVLEYTQLRDSLRSEGEKKRQQGLH